MPSNKIGATQLTYENPTHSAESIFIHPSRERESTKLCVSNEMEAIEEEVDRQVNAAMRRMIDLPEVSDEGSNLSDSADVINQINRAFAAENCIGPNAEHKESVFCTD